MQVAKLISSAKSRSSSTVVKFHLILLLLSAVASLMDQSKASKNKNSDITPPCFPSDLILNRPDVSLPSKTEHSKSCDHSYHLVWYPIAFHGRLSLCTESKAFSKSTKCTYRPVLHSFTVPGARCFLVSKCVQLYSPLI